MTALKFVKKIHLLVTVISKQFFTVGFGLTTVTKLTCLQSKETITARVPSYNGVYFVT